MSALSILAKNTSIKTVDNRPKRWSLVQITMWACAASFKECPVPVSRGLSIQEIYIYNRLHLFRELFYFWVQPMYLLRELYFFKNENLSYLTSNIYKTRNLNLWPSIGEHSENFKALISISEIFILVSTAERMDNESLLILAFISWRKRCSRVFRDQIKRYISLYSTNISNLLRIFILFILFFM
jgi:hypothetical protein